MSSQPTEDHQTPNASTPTKPGLNLGRQQLGDRLITAIGGIFLFTLVFSSWMPRSCPLLRRAIVGCPASTAPRPQAIGGLETDRYANEPIHTDKTYFSVDAGNSRKETAISFHYLPQGSGNVATLAVRMAEGDRPIALITHPLLEGLAWPALKSSSLTLYQKAAAFASLDAFKGALPGAGALAADSAAARSAGLALGKYVPLETLKSLDGIGYVLTTYVPGEQDGRWRLFRQSFDLTSIQTAPDGKLQGAIVLESAPPADKPLLLETVHVDFRSSAH